MSYYHEIYPPFGSLLDELLAGDGFPLSLVRPRRSSWEWMLAVLGDVPLPYQFTLLSAAATTNTRLYSS